MFSAVIIFASGIKIEAQNLEPLIDVVSDKDQKSIEKELKNLAEAGEITQEANTFYNEALALQSNYELDEKTLQKKLRKAEDKAVSLQIKADKMYASAYKSLHEICKRNLAEAAISYGETATLESSADQMMSQAEGKRGEAENARDAYEKAALLNEAAAFEGAAMENLLLALQIQNGVTPAVPEEEPQSTYEPEMSEQTYDYDSPVSEYEAPSTQEDYSTSVYQKSENLAVDQQLIDKYNQYMNDPSMPDPIMINRDGVYGADEISVEEARKYWNQAHSPNSDEYMAASQYTTPVMPVADEDSLAKIAEAGEEYTYTEDYSTSSETETYADAGTETGTTYTGTESAGDDYYDQSVDSRLALDISSSQQVEGVEFMVQVAASRIPLTRSQLWAIYKGNLTVQVYEEQGWYKYRISGFRLFSDANRVAVESGIKDAYVISVYEGQLIGLPEAREMTRLIETDVNRYGRNALKDDTDFYVQVAATRIKFSEEKLKQYCGGTEMCREIIEQGWFKYQIYAGTLYNDALSLKNQIGGDAFIVAYERGRKMELYKAINK